VLKPDLAVNARSMECLMDDAGYMAVYRQKGLIIGTTKIKAAPRKNVSDPWKPMPTLSS
jgi:hypothetical protein